ncbi:MAG: hypothetical protein JRI57_00065 [Deltaproteobacteria bacterium]|nr:hypothetical protein [Deltaproteobacteria bacterium]MBW1951465.1 hypothetical protein [Deltaproteobacteria bacterium]MBW1986894.1 hypothetical protein [Deltaproteobacteria bacterium]MBW2135004.1 hypothetical protein [Deltaproteobacteria bacterium]
MAALTEDRRLEKYAGDELPYKVAGNTVIYANSLVCLNTSGYVVPAADTANYKFLGVAAEYVDNSAGANGAKSVRVWRKGVFEFGASAMAITKICDCAYVLDDQTVGTAAQATNDIACGKIAGFKSATSVLVDIDMR